MSSVFGLFNSTFIRQKISAHFSAVVVITQELYEIYHWI